MRTVEIAHLLGTLIGAAATLTVGLELRLIRRLKSKAATSVERAIELPKLHALSRWPISRLLKNKVVRTTPDGLFYLDLDAHHRLRMRRLTIALPAVLVALIIVAIVHAVFE
jgi:hypothetical protein